MSLTRRRLGLKKASYLHRVPRETDPGGSGPVAGDVAEPDNRGEPQGERGGALGALALPALGMLAAEVLLGVAEGVLDGPAAGIVSSHRAGGRGESGGEEEVVGRCALGVAHDDQAHGVVGAGVIPEHGSRVEEAGDPMVDHGALPFCGSQTGGDLLRGRCSSSRPAGAWCEQTIACRITTSPSQRGLDTVSGAGLTTAFLTSTT